MTQFAHSLLSLFLYNGMAIPGSQFFEFFLLLVCYNAWHVDVNLDDKVSDDDDELNSDSHAELQRNTEMNDAQEDYNVKQKLDEVSVLSSSHLFLS